MNEFSLMDEMDSSISISDMETYEVLYANKKAQSLIKNGEGYKGKKCYEIFQGRTTPCPFCTNGIITRDNFYAWQFYNEYLGIECMIKDKIIEYKGKPARFEIALDINSVIMPRLATDVSKAKKMILQQEELLKNQQSYLDKLYATLPCGLIQFSMDEPRRILNYNDAGWKILGFSSKEEFEQIVKQDVRSLIYGRDQDFFENIIRIVAETGIRKEYELRVVQKDGSIAYTSGVIEVVQIPTGIKVLQDVFVNVTTEKEKDIKLKALVENLPIALAIFEIEKENIRVNYISEGWYKMTGYTTEEHLEISDKVIDKYVYSEDVEATKASMQSAINRKGGMQTECRFVKKNGALIWMSIHSILVSRVDAKSIFYVVYSDIDQIKKSEIEAKMQREKYEKEALQSKRKYENELQYIETISKDVICTAKANITRNKVETYRSNEENEEGIVEFTDVYDEVIKKITESVVNAREKREAEKSFSRKQLLEDFENGKLEFELDCRRKKKNRSFFWIRTQIKLMKEPETGDLIGFIVERDIDKDMVKLSTSRQLLDHMKRISSGKYYFVVAMDYETDSYDVIQCNQRNRVEIPITGKITDLLQEMRKFYHKSSYELLEVLENKLLLEGKFENGKTEWVFEGKAGWIRDKKVGKREKWYEHVIIAVRNEDSEKTIYLLSTTIIDERKEKEEELKRALLQAEKAGKAKQEFLSNMSHEIRTPLNGIIGMLDILKEKERYQDNKLLNNAFVSTRHLSSLLNDILDMAKIDGGKIILQRDLIFMEELIEDVVSIVQMMAEEKGIDCTYKLINSTCQAFYADEKKLKQILINILSNAIKYTKKGGYVKFEILSEQIDDTFVNVKFVVEDNGEGMSKGFIARAFEPFEREEERVGQGGTGLGLAISKQLSELMGGKIEIESEVLKGSRVTIALQVEGSNGEESEKKEFIFHSRKNRFEDVKFEGKRALIVEDNEINMQIVQLQLESVGIEIDMAFDGEEAIAKVKKSKEGYYDIIFMDVMMPKKDGLVATREIRALNRKDVKEMAIVAMTANVFAEDVHKSLESGMTYHLSKPFHKIKVMEILTQEFYGE